MAAIDRVVLIKLSDEARDSVDATIARAGEVLSGIPQVIEFEIWRGADAKSAGDWDFGIHARFDDIESVETYIKDEGHRQWVDQELKPKMLVIKAWNFRRTRNA